MEARDDVGSNYAFKYSHANYITERKLLASKILLDTLRGVKENKSQTDTIRAIENKREAGNSYYITISAEVFTRRKYS